MLVRLILIFICILNLACEVELDGELISHVKVLTSDGGHVDLLKDGSGLIVFDRKGADGYFDIWTMNVNGQNQKNLTHNAQILPGKHIGQPAWHPNGKRIVFQAQKDGMPKIYDNKAVPGAGILNDLWLMTTDGSKFWKLVDLPLIISEDSPGILHPHFSHNGKSIIWSQRIGGGLSTFGAWVIKLADFSVIPTPNLRNIRTLTPGQYSKSVSFYETHGFSPDGNKIIFTSDFEKGLNIYTFDLKISRIERLTNSAYSWDEHALFSPDGEKIIWMSSRNLRFVSQPFILETEWWIMDNNGQNKKRLTFFHDQSHPHYQAISKREPLCVPADFAWGGDGGYIVGLIIHGHPDSKERGSGEIVKLTFN